MPSTAALREDMDITPAGGGSLEFLTAHSHGRLQGVEAARPAPALPEPTAYVIEIDDEAVGLVTSHPQGVSFHAVDMRASALEGQVFTDAAAARAAAESAFYGRE
ncbi:hypothetical protein [Nitrospirillum sp. BR 11828]|uniref:hypothetical protein n=1 Tax=Nitrospirillum sp. BR 11828 TaxID=3104325 RepID=UPI002ACAD266|nr:hypothetical protein [Nitrospirillum sp. BR 11828]MDZ5648211.1 hypothetical protein [Nitrospirillum sp. BR 11828]